MDLAHEAGIAESDTSSQAIGEGYHAGWIG